MNYHKYLYQIERVVEYGTSYSHKYSTDSYIAKLDGYSAELAQINNTKKKEKTASLYCS